MIGLAGTILVTGIAPVMVTELGAASVPVIVIITLTGYLVCLMLAELSAMMPDRSGGLPSYAYPAYRIRWPRFAEHVNGFTAWAYWLGWFPVAPLNMILASLYIADRFHLSTAGFSPLGTTITWWTLGISIVGLIVLSIPAVRGLRFGALKIGRQEAVRPVGRAALRKGHLRQHDKRRQVRVLRAQSVGDPRRRRPDRRRSGCRCSCGNRPWDGRSIRPGSRGRRTARRPRRPVACQCSHISKPDLPDLAKLERAADEYRLPEAMAETNWSWRANSLHVQFVAAWAWDRTCRYGSGRLP